MSQRYGGAFFMGQNYFLSAAYGPWIAVAQPPVPEFRGPFLQRRPLMVRWMGQGQPTPPAGSQPLTPEAAKEWADKVDVYLGQVQAIQDYVKAHPTEAAAAGLDRDAANLPPSGALASYPRLKAVYDKLRAGDKVEPVEVGCIVALEAALGQANEKLARLQAQEAAPSILTPTNIGIGAGILALVAGLVVLS
jgi:hypothetical protein